MTTSLNQRTLTDQTAHDNLVKDLLTENARLRGDLLTIAGRICHDLRAPLGGVVVNGEALKEILAEGDSAASPLVDLLLASTDEIVQLIKRTSFITKASASPVVMERVNMADVIVGVFPQLESRINESGASITCPDSWPEVNGVSAWLETIWWNLLANALQHAGKAPKIEVGWRQEGDTFRFWVSDSGGGVLEANRRKLFQRFQSLHEMDSTRGLGLSIVQRLVELQGGDCGYDSPAKGGANFFFKLRVGTDPMAKQY